jgi:hypothetical protein
MLGDIDIMVVFVERLRSEMKSKEQKQARRGTQAAQSRTITDSMFLRTSSGLPQDEG